MVFPHPTAAFFCAMSAFSGAFCSFDGKVVATFGNYIEFVHVFRVFSGCFYVFWKGFRRFTTQISKERISKNRKELGRKEKVLNGGQGSMFVRL